MSAEDSGEKRPAWWGRQSRKVRFTILGVGAVAAIGVAMNLAGVTPETEDADPSAEATEEPTTTAVPESTEDPTPEPEEESETGSASAPVETEGEAVEPLDERVSAAVLAARAFEHPDVTTWEQFAERFTVVYSPDEVDGENLAYLHGTVDLWPSLIRDVSLNGDGRIEVTVGVNSQSPDWDAEEIGTAVANYFMIEGGYENEDLRAVHVMTTDGLEVGYQDRSVLDY